MADDDEIETLAFPEPEAWDAWLRRHRASTDAVLIRFARRGSEIPSITWDEAVEVALVWGWIDGVRHSVDAQWYTIRFSPRLPGSTWSHRNVQTAERLIARGLMQPAGFEQVRAARHDGRWARAYSQRWGAVPEELARALEQSPKAEAAWIELDAQNRGAMCFRVRRPVHQERRIARARRFIEMLEQGERIYQ